MATSNKKYKVTLTTMQLEAINGDTENAGTYVDAIGIANDDGSGIDKIGITVYKTEGDTQPTEVPDEIEEPVETVVVDDEIGNVNPEEQAAGVATESVSESKLFNFDNFLKKK